MIILFLRKRIDLFVIPPDDAIKFFISHDKYVLQSHPRRVALSEKYIHLLQVVESFVGHEEDFL